MSAQGNEMVWLLDHALRLMSEAEEGRLAERAATRGKDINGLLMALLLDPGATAATREFAGKVLERLAGGEYHKDAIDILSLALVGNDVGALDVAARVAASTSFQSDLRDIAIIRLQGDLPDFVREQLQEVVEEHP